AVATVLARRPRVEVALAEHRAGAGLDDGGVHVPRGRTSRGRGRARDREHGRKHDGGGAENDSPHGGIRPPSTGSKVTRHLPRLKLMGQVFSWPRKEGSCRPFRFWPPSRGSCPRRGPSSVSCSGGPWAASRCCARHSGSPKARPVWKRSRVSCPPCPL